MVILVSAVGPYSIVLILPSCAKEGIQSMVIIVSLHMKEEVPLSQKTE